MNKLKKINGFVINCFLTLVLITLIGIILINFPKLINFNIVYIEFCTYLCLILLISMILTLLISIPEDKVFFN